LATCWAQGNLPEALKSFRDGHAVFEHLAKADPGNALWQRDLSVSYDRIGDMLVAQGNLPEALKSYRDGLAIRDRLAKADPATPAGGATCRCPMPDWSVQEGGRQDKGARLIAPGPRDHGAHDEPLWKRVLAWFDGQIAELAR
jgi:tetratricopeptide (TPR) repeat protein